MSVPRQRLPQNTICVAWYPFGIVAFLMPTQRLERWSKRRGLSLYSVEGRNSQNEQWGLYVSDFINDQD